MGNAKMCAIFGEGPDELEFGYDEDYYLCAIMKYRLVAALQESVMKGYVDFVSTVEQGAPMWGAEACDAIKQLGGEITFTAAPNSEDQADRWHPERRERYFGMLERADEIIEPVGELYGTEYILSHADRVIVLGDTTHKRLHELTKRAEDMGIEVIIA